MNRQYMLRKIYGITSKIFSETSRTIIKSSNNFIVSNQLQQTKVKYKIEKKEEPPLSKKFKNNFEDLYKSIKNIYINLKDDEIRSAFYNLLYSNLRYSSILFFLFIIYNICYYLPLENYYKVIIQISYYILYFRFFLLFQTINIFTTLNYAKKVKEYYFNKDFLQIEHIEKEESLKKYIKATSSLLIHFIVGLIVIQIISIFFYNLIGKYLSYPISFFLNSYFKGVIWYQYALDQHEISPKKQISILTTDNVRCITIGLIGHAIYELINFIIPIQPITMFLSSILNITFITIAHENSFNVPVIEKTKNMLDKLSILNPIIFSMNISKYIVNLLGNYISSYIKLIISYIFKEGNVKKYKPKIWLFILKIIIPLELRDVKKLFTQKYILPYIISSNIDQIIKYIANIEKTTSLSILENMMKISSLKFVISRLSFVVARRYKIPDSIIEIIMYLLNRKSFKIAIERLDSAITKAIQKSNNEFIPNVNIELIDCRENYTQEDSKIKNKEKRSDYEEIEKGKENEEEISENSDYENNKTETSDRSLGNAIKDDNKELKRSSSLRCVFYHNQFVIDDDYLKRDDITFCTVAT